MAEVTHNPAEQRFEIHDGGTLAGFVEYVDHGDHVVLPHTRVFEEFGGRGLASILVRGALDDLRAGGRRVHATCPYVRAWLRRNPDYADLVTGHA